jgi:DNA-binding MarR family transcriptional regulator
MLRALGVSGWPGQQCTNSGISRIQRRFYVFRSIAGDSASVGFVHLRQISECAADLVEFNDISCYDISVTTKTTQLSTREFQALAEFRFQIRRFLRFSEDQARAAGIEPQQHQLLLAIKGLPDGVKPTIGELASRMLIRHHSAVELVDRLAEHGAVERMATEEDHRQVLVRLTRKGETLLHGLSVAHHDELLDRGPELMKSLRKVLGQS